MLNSEIKTSIKTLLDVLAPLWLDEPLVDSRRVTRPMTPGQFEIAIEPYRGVRTVIALQKKLEQREDVRDLGELIRVKQPELLGHVHSPQITHRHNIRDVNTLIAFWCSQISQLVKTMTLSQAVDKLVKDLEQTLQTGKATLRFFAPIAGLDAPTTIGEITLAPSIKLQRLTADELTDLGSHDVYMSSDVDIMSRNLKFAAVITEQADVCLRIDGMGDPFDHQTATRAQETIRALLSALSILKEGRVSVMSTQASLIPNVLPGMVGGTSRPFAQPFESMELSQAEVDRLPSVYAALMSATLAEVRIAASRLQDAERRFSPVDSLLDAVIGLETILNPQDFAELAFRVAINYAFLAPATERRERYESIRDVQRTRNGIVHGGLSLSSSKGSLIREHSELAKRCLRDALNRFLDDPQLSPPKLDADFWLDRIIPPN